jgi:CheY-like chemotaxis protein
MSEATAGRDQDHRSGGGTTVLVVDDEPGVRRLVVRILERAGYGVVAAENGAEARELFRAHGSAIDLLLTDVMMPGMSGPELAAHLTRERHGLKVLYMSGYTAGTLRAAAGFRPETDLIRKPFTPDDILDAVRRRLTESAPG